MKSQVIHFVNHKKPKNLFLIYGIDDMFRIDHNSKIGALSSTLVKHLICSSLLIDTVIKGEKMKKLVFILSVIASSMAMAKVVTWESSTRVEACTGAKQLLETTGGGKPQSDCDCSKKDNGTWVCAAESRN
jgi:hypothetical protein